MTDKEKKNKTWQSPISCINGNYLDLSLVWHMCYEMGNLYINGVSLVPCSFEQYSEIKIIWLKLRSRKNNDR